MDNVIQLTHTYRKIKASFKLAPNNLFRTFLVRSDLNLSELGCVLCTMFHAEYEHCFLFETPAATYVPEVFMDDYFTPGWLLMDDYSVSDLPDNFTFEYDTGESWEFKCRLYKKEEVRTDSRRAILIEGAGAGIWEDAKYEFLTWLEGEIPPTKKHTKDELPWNLKFKTFAELDNPLDIAKEQKAFDSRIESDTKIYLDHMAAYTDDFDDSDDDFDDDFDEEDDPSLTVILAGTAYQIGNVPFVGNAFNRLIKKHSEDEAFDMIASELCKQIEAVLTQENSYSSESYRKAIENLK